MIALWLAGQALAQDNPTPPVVPPAEPPAEPAPVPVEPAPVPAEPAPVPAEPAPVPVEPVAPSDQTYFLDEPQNLQFEADIELGSILNPDPAYDLFADHDAMGDWGFRVGFRPIRRLQVRGGWHLARHGADVYVAVPETGADFTSGAQGFRAAMVAHEATLGARVDASVEDIFLPYLAADGLLFAGRIRVDDTPEDRNNPGQVQQSGVSGGVIGVGGIELRVPPDSPVAVGWNLEIGYAWVASVDFGDFGKMKPGGLAVRSGVGVRF